ncbi:MAG: 2OG-Fe(II) oxygenase [bacterium]
MSTPAKTTQQIFPNGLINPIVMASIDELHRQFIDALPFQHLIIDDFFDPQFVQSLAASFPAFDDAKATDESGKLGQKCVHEAVKALGEDYCRLDALVQNQEFLNVINSITGIDELIYDPLYYGGGTHENRGGQDLDPHIDFNYHPVTNHHRRLNLILFLNEEWRDDWGGLLELYADPDKEGRPTKTITPLLNRLVMFVTTEHSWHGFRRINASADSSRKSFALYYYTMDRPVAETAPRHSTVYVERHLPSDILAGEVLTEAQLNEVQRLLHRRDQHTKRLYSDIQGLMSELDIHTQSWTMRQARRAVNLVAKCRKLLAFDSRMK